MTDRQATASFERIICHGPATRQCTNSVVSARCYPIYYFMSNCITLCQDGKEFRPFPHHKMINSGKKEAWRPVRRRDANVRDVSNSIGTTSRHNAARKIDVIKICVYRFFYTCCSVND